MFQIKESVGMGTKTAFTQHLLFVALIDPLFSTIHTGFANRFIAL